MSAPENVTLVVNDQTINVTAVISEESFNVESAVNETEDNVSLVLTDDIPVVILSEQPNNKLEMLSDGLYVPEETTDQDLLVYYILERG